MITAIDFKEKYSVFRHQFTVDESVKQGFQQCSGDFNPLHNDVTFANRKGFPQCVMYGNVLNCFVSYFIGEMLPTQEVIIHSQEITYRQPVFLGDTLDFTAKVDEVYEMVNSVDFSFNFRNESGKIVAKGKIQIGLIPDVVL